ncbi:MAG: hypothetical protein V7767_04795 [Leeuwenhoekiella sp.]
MKKIQFIIFVLGFTTAVNAQLLPGTLDVQGMPNFSQSFTDVIAEAGEDDASLGFETTFNATEIGFVLDPTSLFGTEISNTESNCSANVFRYKVYMHTINAPADIIIEARTFTDSGSALPAIGASPYDNLIIQPLGPRGLTPENGGDYISVPNNASQAIKVFEFIGCRTSIPIQFKVRPSAKARAIPANIDVYYTVVGSLM